MTTHNKPLNDFDIDTICAVVHEAMRAYAKQVKGEHMPAWSRAPSWMKVATRNSVEAVISNPNQTPGTQHALWLEAKRKDGWKYGDTKDARRKTHPLLIPFEQLPSDERLKDALLISIVRAFLFD